MTTPRDDMDALFREAINFATYLLEKNREFYPFAVTLDFDGQIAHAEGWTGEEYPKSTELLDLLQESLKEDAANGEIKAAVLVADVRIREHEAAPAGDAIQVHIEHMHHNPVACFLPYRLEGGKLIEGEAFAEAADPVILPKAGHA
jgi:hypothetical protein